MRETSAAKQAKAEPSRALTLASTVVATRDQASCALGEEAVILDMAGGVYFGLNQVGARIWELLKTPRRVQSIRDELLAEYEVDAGACEQDLLRVLEEMRSAGLVEVR